MIELDEKDIKAVARSRLYRQKRWKLLMVTPLGVLILLFIVDWTTGLSEKWLAPAVIAVAVGFLVLIIWYSRKENKAEQELLKEWKKVLSSEHIEGVISMRHND